MKEVFTIPVWEKDGIDKAIARFKRKAAAYGKILEAEWGEPYAKMRSIFSEDTVTHTSVKIDDEWVEVCDLTIDSEVIQKDGYSVVAKLEHLENGNFVRSFVDEPNPDWQKLEPKCEHCNTKHYRANTFIVRHEDGSEKQVGTTCLKDYCGIDPKHFADLKKLHDLFLRDDIGGYDFEHCERATKIYPIVDAIALAARIEKAQGYVKADYPDSNKSKLWTAMSEKIKPNDDEVKAANDMIDEIMKMEHGDTYSRLDFQKIWFENTLKPLIVAGYCKNTHFGYIAYTPIAFERYLEAKAEAERREAERKNQAKVSSYIGEVGKKIEVDVDKMDLVTSWENAYGRTYLYKIIDTTGNVLVWYASKCVDAFKRLRGTVKDHNERDGIKQTVVTRCRAI